MRGGAWASAMVVLLGCHQRTPHSVQLEALDRATPADIAAPDTPAQRPASHVITVHVLVDDDYASQVLHPDELIRAQFFRASRYAAAAVDTRFEVASIDRWPHRAGVADVNADLDALIAFSKDDAADLVVGFISALPVVQRQQDVLGSAALFGHQMVVRGFSDSVELPELRRELPALDDDELVDFSKKRRMHMETVLLLHEWAHTLGAPHDTDSASFMQREYLLSMVSYSPLSQKVIYATLAARAAHQPLTTQARVVRERVEADAQYAPDRVEFLAQLRALENQAPRAAVFGHDDQLGYEKARQLYQAAMYEESKRALAPLVQQFPAMGALRSLDCIVRRQLSAKDALPVCQAGATAATSSAIPTLQLAQTQLELKDAAAVDTLQRGLALLEGTVDDAESGWGVAVAVAQNAQCVSWTERAAAHATKAPEVDQAVAWARTMRRWASLPEVSPGCERAHLERFRRALASMERDLRAAQREIDTFGPGPAHDSLSCELSFRRGALKDARTACERAVAAYAESTHAHYLLGVIAEREHHLDEEVRELSKVVELGPENDDAWSRLAQAYTRGHDEPALNSLQARYAARFGHPLR